MDKTTGYALLWGGVAIILYSVMMAWKVFSGAAAPPSLINLQSIVIPVSGTQLTIPLDPEISKTANISLHFLFLMLVAGAGNKIGNFGVKLISPAKAETKKEG